MIRNTWIYTSYQFLREILDILENITDCCFLGKIGSEPGFIIFVFQSCIAGMN